ncbi:hypothetical protein Tco_1044011 [Tanacetum coccineum]|uniref:Uncharacterized protein n=1 Tax=Tanacetum coccineum TaxID=301880 RepID=A0ABQ5GNT1_9ASTR
MTDNVGKKVICYNYHGEGHVSRQCKEKKRVKDSQYFKDKMLLMEAKEKGTVLDAEAEAFLADVEYEGPHAAAAFMANLSSTSGTNGATTGQVNEEQSLVNDSLRAELARCKQEMVSLERNKVKHDLDQAIIQRNKRNAELEEENVLLKSKLSQNVESINSLKMKVKRLFWKRRYLEEQVTLFLEGSVPRTGLLVTCEERATQEK